MDSQEKDGRPGRAASSGIMVSHSHTVIPEPPVALQGVRHDRVSSIL